jgi:hypothetical protein
MYWLFNFFAVFFFNLLPSLQNRVRGGAVVEALRCKPEVAGSIPNGVIGIFH